MTQRDRESLLLGALFAADGAIVPTYELAALSGLPARQLEGALEPYRVAGYPIVFHPQGGVALNDPPDVWCAEEILGRCPPPPNRWGWEPLLLAETASTNDVAREQARRGVRAGFVVAATHQTAGRGRLGRRWESTRGAGLYVSILLRPELAAKDAGQLAVLGCVASADAVEQVCGVRPGLKWPNDLRLKNRKLGGLLIETEQKAGGGLACAIVGLGLNLHRELADFSPEMRELATSLPIATGCTPRRADLLVALLHALDRRLAEPFAATREEWAAGSLTLGQQVTLTTARGKKYGQAVGLDDSGALLLRADSGEIEAITAGDMDALPPPTK